MSVCIDILTSFETNAYVNIEAFLYVYDEYVENKQTSPQLAKFGILAGVFHYVYMNMKNIFEDFLYFYTYTYIFYTNTHIQRTKYRPPYRHLNRVTNI